MNEWKPAILVKGKPLIYHSIDLMLNFCDEVIISGGYNFAKLEELIYNNKFYTDRIKVVMNTEYQLGMLSSVKIGLNHIDDNTDGIFIQPGDMPFVDNITYSTLIKEFNEKDEYDVFIPITTLEEENNVRQKKGHPVLIKSRCIPFIKDYDTTKTFRDVIKELNVCLCNVQDNGIIFDIDEPKDFEKAINY